MSKELLKFRWIISLMVFLAVLVLAPMESSAQEPYQVSIYSVDFGFVGIDYKIYYTYKIRNLRRKPITIDSLKVNCDCTTVIYDKKVLKAGETSNLKLTFDTKDFYGPVNRKFEVFLGLPEHRVVTLFYKAHVGQWINGLKPDPFSVFLLPTQNKQSIKITNKFFDDLKVEIEHQNDDYFSLEIVNGKANKEEQLEILLKVAPDLAKGTYYSNFTMKVTGKLQDKDESSFLTIPVKIVRF